MVNFKETFEEVSINKLMIDQLHDERLALNNELVGLLDSFKKE
jgi:hypothetical protein